MGWEGSELGAENGRPASTPRPSGGREELPDFMVRLQDACDNPDPDKEGYSGQPVCNGGSSQDFNNNVVFDKARLERHRLILGMNYRYEMVILGVHFITDITDPGDAQVGGNSTQVSSSDDDVTISDTTEVSDKDLLANEQRQWTLVVQLGTMF